MDTINNLEHNNSSNDILSLRELIELYLSKWHWFVISLFVCLFLACAYLLKTVPTYSRSASILIKEDAKGQSIATDVANTFSKMGMFNARTNIDNEIVNFQSPDLMYEVVKRLHLDVNYTKDGRFHKEVLYGDQLPFILSFDNLDNQEIVSLTVTPKDEENVLLSDFSQKGEDIVSDPIAVRLGDTIQTPVGRLVVSPSPYFGDSTFVKPIYVRRLSLYTTANIYQNRLSVALEGKNTTVIKLSVEDQNIQRAEEILNTVINVYNENWIKDKNQITTSTNEFISDRLEVIQKELGHVDNDITSFKSENMIPDLTMAVGMDMQQSAEEEKHITDLNNQIGIARYLQNFISGSVNQLMPANAGLEENNIQTLINEYNTTQLQRNRLVESSSEENLLVKDLDQQLSSLRSTILSSIDNYIAALNMQVGTSQSARSKANARIVSNPRQAGQLLSSERQQKVKESLYLFLLQKREENELSQAFTSYSTRVIATPEHGGSFLPTSPNKRNIILIAFVLGLAIPMGLLHLKETLNTTIRSRKDLESMAVPFIGEIPQINKKKLSVITQIRNILSKKKVEKGKGINAIVVKAKSRSIINEAFRVIRTNMEFMKKNENGAHVIMLTSANPGSGKTFISANLSSAMAIKGKRTIVIDLDLRKKTLGEYFSQPKLGVADYLSGNVKDYKSLIVYHEKDADPIDVLTVGTMPPNPAELLSDDRLSLMISELRQEYDYIFLDCPPIEIVTDADIINPLADTTIFVVRAGLFERSMLNVIDKFYNAKKYNNLCLILNGTETTGNRYSYKYGYGKRGYGYGYGYGYTHDDE